MTTRPWTLIVAAALLLLIGGSGMAAGASLLGVAINGSMTEDVRGAGLRIGMGIATYGFAAVVAGVGLVLVRRWAWRLGVLLVIVGLVGLVGPLVALGQVDPILASGVVIWGVAFACLISPPTQRAIRR
jgi:MFS family permease